MPIPQASGRHRADAPSAHHCPMAVRAVLVRPWNPPPCQGGRTAAATPPRKALMTLRVYRTPRDGAVTEERAPLYVLAGDMRDVYGLSQAWPPCACPRHRDGR
ncbi:hypothetical protein AB0B07_23340 [Streptomyces sioyaensis]|uniref:hypothetical protein n=1 Tax=Streptomyces sioyaensis TaxID=67364 RepID=UPI00340010F1